MGIEILAYEETPLGILCLRRRDLLSQPDISVTEVTLNHEFLMSSYLTDSERALTRCGMDRIAPNADAGEFKVLVGGLGLGYTAAESLKFDSVSSVEVVEFLPEVIGWMRDGLIPLSDSMNADERLLVTHGDIYHRLTQPGSGLFDLIAIDVDHSPEDVLGEQSQTFYSTDGLNIAKSHLAVGGVIGIWSYAESTPLLENMKQVFGDVSVEKVTVMNDLIHEEQTDWLFFGRNPG